MSEKYIVEPASELRFDWAYRQFERIQLTMGLLSDGHVYKYASHSQATDGSTLNIGTDTEYLVYLVDPSGGTVTVNLPPITNLTGRMFYIKNVATAPGQKLLNVTPNGTDKIDRRQVNQPPSSVTLVIDRLDSIQLMSDNVSGTWWII